jgi:glycosyltransferase involved in cell wall biosynthesis
MDSVVAVSEELADDLSSSCDLAPDTVTVIPNGVDLERITGLAKQPLEHPFFADDGVPVILGVGRLSRQKNFEALLRGFARARSHRPLRLLILGPGSEARRARLRRLAATLGIGEAVAIEGYCANPFPYMRRAGLLALTSRWEGASNVLLEAMACGCPVVAVEVPTGVAEVLEGGAVGPLVAPGDDAALAGAMLDRLARPRASDALVDRAGRYALRSTLGAYVEFLTSELDAFARGCSST